MTIDELRSLCATEGMTDDDAVLEFHAWREGREWADAMIDDGADDTAATLASWFKNGLPAVTLGEVKAWLEECANPDEIDMSDADVETHLAEWRMTTPAKKS